MRHSSKQSLVELRARQLRSALTPSEQKLWAAINGGQLGVWFRRRVLLGRFIADFVAPAARLVVEVDGPYHARRKSADASRDHKLARLGYRVVRLESSLVEQRPDVAIACIRAALEPPG